MAMNVDDRYIDLTLHDAKQCGSCTQLQNRRHQNRATITESAGNELNYKAWEYKTSKQDKAFSTNDRKAGVRLIKGNYNVTCERGSFCCKNGRIILHNFEFIEHMVSEHDCDNQVHHSENTCSNSVNELSASKVREQGGSFIEYLNDETQNVPEHIKSCNSIGYELPIISTESSLTTKNGLILQGDSIDIRACTESKVDKSNTNTVKRSSVYRPRDAPTADTNAPRTTWTKCTTTERTDTEVQYFKDTNSIQNNDGYGIVTEIAENNQTSDCTANELDVRSAVSHVRKNRRFAGDMKLTAYRPCTSLDTYRKQYLEPIKENVTLGLDVEKGAAILRDIDAMVKNSSKGRVKIQPDVTTINCTGRLGLGDQISKTEKVSVGLHSMPHINNAHLPVNMNKYSTNELVIQSNSNFNKRLRNRGLFTSKTNNSNSCKGLLHDKQDVNQKDRFPNTTQSLGAFVTNDYNHVICNSHMYAKTQTRSLDKHQNEYIHVNDGTQCFEEPGFDKWTNQSCPRATDTKVTLTEWATVNTKQSSSGLGLSLSIDCEQLDQYNINVATDKSVTKKHDSKENEIRIHDPSGGICSGRRRPSITMTTTTLPRITPASTPLPTGITQPPPRSHSSASMYATYPPKDLSNSFDYLRIPQRVNPLAPPPPRRRINWSWETTDQHYENEKRRIVMQKREHTRYHSAWSKAFYGAPAEKEAYNRHFREVLKQQMADKKTMDKQEWQEKTKETTYALAYDQQCRQNDAEDYYKKHCYLMNYRDINKQFMEDKWSNSKYNKELDNRIDRERLRYNPINWSHTLK